MIKGIIPKTTSTWLKLFHWRQTHISDKQLVIFLSILVGIGCAIAAAILKSIVEALHHWVNTAFSAGNLNYLFLATPIVGIILASSFVKYVVKDDISHGVTKIMYAISRNKAIIKAHNMWSSVVASSLTIGFGGSVGAEAPIVLTGSAIGSNLGKMFRLDQKKLMLLVGCGATGAVAGIFKAPITGVLFTLEVLMLDLTMASIVPLIVTAITATVITFFISGTESQFAFDTTVSIIPKNIPYYVLEGIVCGFVSLYFVRGSNKLETFFRNINRRWKKLVVGGSMLSLLIFFIPPLYGEGYDTISSLINGDSQSITDSSVFYEFRENFWMLCLFCLLIVFFKIFATAATNGSGGTGGIFAPSLFMGCVSGFITASIINHLHITNLPTKNFALAGMAGVMAGVMHAPLTGIFLIAELTGGYQLFIPLMIVSICAYLTIIIFEPHSIYGMRLAREGKLITHHTDKSVLTLMSLESIIDRQYTPLSVDLTLGQLVKKVSMSGSEFLPVLDKGGKLLGEIDLMKIRHLMFRTELYQHFTVAQIMSKSPGVLGFNDPMEDVMSTFDKTDAAILPVTDTEGRLIGYINRTRMYAMYRKIVADFSQE